MKSLLKTEKLDQIGITASVACAIHCAAVPLVITALPLFGLEFLADTRVELFMICLSLVIAISALSTSYWRHRKLIPTFVLLTGFLFIAMGHFAIPEGEAYLVPFGGTLVATAHLLNWRFSKKYRLSVVAQKI